MKMSKYYDNAIEKLAAKFGGYITLQSFRLLTIDDQKFWKQRAIDFLKLTPEIAIVNHNANINFMKYGITVEQAKAILNDGFVKEVKNNE